MEVLRRSSVLAAEIMDAFDRSPTDKELVAQAKALGREFVHARLLRAGLAWSAPERAAPAPGGRLAEVCAVLLRLGDELELIRPSVYRNVARQLHISLQSEPVVTDAFLAVAGHIFSAGITWGKVVSLYAVAAGLAVDCVRQAQPAMVHALVDCLGEFVRKTLATWLRRRGGWAARLPDPSDSSNHAALRARECGGSLTGSSYTSPADGNQETHITWEQALSWRPTPRTAADSRVGVLLRQSTGGGRDRAPAPAPGFGQPSSAVVGVWGVSQGWEPSVCV
ncbi:bcl-2-related ovarian killer protein isoform X2 [Oryctolagus cuniculus]|nr:bcl-2-related ovarian killer protein isoform X2 [Oryctolagus cuniculus]